MRYLLYVPVILISYLIGSTNMAHFLSRRKGFDIREAGSGNMGASNAMVTMGWGAGVITALYDIGKAALCVFAAEWVLGHIFPFYLNFRGGKGLASFLGMTLGLDWRVFLGACLVILLVTLITDYIVYATIATAVCVPIALAVLHRRPLLAAILFIATVVMILKHRENFRRLREGTEIGLLRAHKGEGRVK